MSNLESNKKIIKNTAFLFLRMFLIMVVNLYTSRIVLNLLGVEDFGIYNVVSGIVLLFSFFNSAMEVGTQRFLSFELGKNNHKQLSKVYTTSIIVHISIAVIALLLLETIGLWYLNKYINVPSNRIVALNWVYQFTIISFIFLIIRVPFNALIISYERMSAFAYFSIVEVFLKLALVFLLKIIVFDKLITYSVITFLVTLLITLMYIFYCYAKIKECKYTQIIDKKLFFLLISYSGWNLVGAISNIGSSYGINLIINIFWGVTVNAAYAIAFQIKSAVMSLSSNFQIAMNPQIIKSYASSDYDYMQIVIYRGAKYSFYILYIITLPILINSHFILKMWLGFVPEYSNIFTKLMLITVLIDSISGTLMIASQASGKIKVYQIIMGSIIILNLPISYIFMKNGFNPSVVFIIGIIISIISLFVRICLVSNLIQVSIVKYLKQVLGNITLTILISLITPLIAFYLFNISLFVFSLMSLVSSIITIYFLGLDKFERNQLKLLLYKIPQLIKYHQ